MTHPRLSPAVLAAVTALLLYISAVVAVAAPPFTAIVVKVADGDSYTMQRRPDAPKERIRLHWADAPEVARSKRGKPQPGGEAARDFAAKLLLGKEVALVSRGRSYDRVVADVTVGGTDIATELVRNGWAMCDTKYHPPKSLIDAQAEAKQHRKGIWSSAGEPTAPWVWRQQQRNRIIEPRRN